MFCDSLKESKPNRKRKGKDQLIWKMVSEDSNVFYEGNGKKRNDYLNYWQHRLVSLPNPNFHLTKIEGKTRIFKDKTITVTECTLNVKRFTIRKYILINSYAYTHTYAHTNTHTLIYFLWSIQPFSISREAGIHLFGNLSEKTLECITGQTFFRWVIHSVVSVLRSGRIHSFVAIWIFVCRNYSND